MVGIHDQPIIGEADVIVGNIQAASTLRSAGIESAQTLVLAGADDALNLAILMQARVLNPQIRIINRLFNTSLGDRLDQTLPKHVTMSVAALAAPVFAFDALGSQAIGQLRLFNQIWPLHEEYINEDHPWNGRRLRDLWDERERMLLYYLPVDSRIDLVSAVVHGHNLQQGDRLSIGTKPSIRTTRKPLRKLLKVLLNLRQFQQHGKPVVVMAVVLFVTIFIATLQAANLDQAAALLSVTNNDTANLEIALNARGLKPSIPVIVRYEDPDFAQMAQQVFEFEAVLSPAELAAPAFAAAALGGRILGNGITADSLWVGLATLITPLHPFCGQLVRELAMAGDFVPLYIETNCQTIHSWDLLNTCLSAGDVLYLTMPATGLEQLWRAAPSQLMMS